MPSASSSSVVGGTRMSIGSPPYCRPRSMRLASDQKTYQSSTTSEPAGGVTCAAVYCTQASACSAMPSVIRSEEHTSELQSLMRISYAVFCLKKKKNKTHKHIQVQKDRNKTTNTNIIKK